MMKMMSRLTALLLALLVLALPVWAMAEEEDEDDTLPETVTYSETDAENEEDSDSVFTVEPGTYEWYMLPAEMEDGHAYVSIIPAEETIYPTDGVWRYTFNLEEQNGVAFKPFSVTFIGFCDGTELTRSTSVFDDHAGWWILEIPAYGAEQCSGEEMNANLTALAISIIGTDATDYEQEFHGIVFLEK